MSQSSPLQWSRRSALVNYAVAVLSVVAALVAALQLEPHMHGSAFVSLSLCAIMFGAWFGGLGPGLSATALSVAGFTYYFVPPIGSFAVAPTDLPRIVLLAVTALFVVWLNVARRGAEGALRRSEAYLADAQRLSHTGSFGWRIASGNIVWSKETYRIFGVDETVKPTIDLILQRVHPADRELVLHEIDRAALGEPSYDYEHRLLMPNGEIKHLTVRTHRAKYESGEEELVGALMGVTATREAQEALYTAQTELARVARVTALGQMSASIAHEVNQPLASIASTAAAGLRWLTREVPEVDEARTCVSHIVEEANRASEIIRSVRDLARRADPELIPLDINEVIDEAVALVKPEALRTGASLSGLALKAGVNANQLRKWVQLREQSTAPARSNTAVGLPAFVPVVAIDDTAPVSATALAARTTHERECADPSPPATQGARLSARLPNGVMLELECSGHDAALVSAMIAALGAR